MYVTNYQMHNVLKVYTSHLSRDKAAADERLTIRRPNSDTVQISAEGKRQNLIERIGAEIIARITDKGYREKDARKPAGRFDSHTEALDKTANNHSDRFVYNVIRGDAVKKTNTMSVQDPAFFVQRFEELVKNALEGELG